jgi:hypothetical protein
MVENLFKPYFRVKETYEEHGHLILVADTTDSALAKTLEEIEIRRVGKPALRIQATLVKFWGRDPNVRAPLCLAVSGLKPNDVPAGTQVCRQESEPVRIGRKRFERIEVTPADPIPAPTSVTKKPSAKMQGKEAV